MTKDGVTMKTVVFSAVVLSLMFLSGCDLSGTPAIPGKLRRELASKGIALWERDVTEAASGMVLGHILRGKTNLSIRGQLSREDIQGLERGLNVSVQKKLRLFRLDFSNTVLLSPPEETPEAPDDSETPVRGESPDAAVPLSSSLLSFKIEAPRLGAIHLPPGIADVQIGREGGTPFLLEVGLPESGLGTEKLLITGAFTQIVIPSDAGTIQLRSSNDFTAILAEGRTSMEFITVTGGTTGNFIGASENLWTWREKDPLFTLVIPSTLREFTGQLPGCQEIYSYASSPPLATDFQEYRFPDLQTVYVPAGSELAYEEAWFNYTSADFMPLPPSRGTIESFMEIP
ncbi:MAG: hypothetical protein LBU21_02180 [Treponema sp.]|jgi:hypothetical protein|nr:hypothetical protein [Treponema sp.]